MLVATPAKLHCSELPTKNDIHFQNINFIRIETGLHFLTFTELHNYRPSIKTGKKTTYCLHNQNINLFASTPNKPSSHYEVYEKIKIYMSQTKTITPKRGAETQRSERERGYSLYQSGCTC